MHLNDGNHFDADNDEDENENDDHVIKRTPMMLRMVYDPLHVQFTSPALTPPSPPLRPPPP